MKFFKEFVKNTIIYILWISMFLVLWPVTDGWWWRIPASISLAMVLGLVQTIFKK
ncbi:MAG: hypothetical protein FWD49_01600 [Firmicutes bacterium]|nr:hypothetical protein [Bacillota bacterium]